MAKQPDKLPITAQDLRELYYVYHIKLPHHQIDEGYVGVSKDPKTRWSNHRSRKENPILSRAISKYGAKLRYEILGCFENLGLANIYTLDGDVVAENVCVRVWARENGYHQGHLSATARGPLKQHKGIYARYTDAEAEQTLERHSYNGC